MSFTLGKIWCRHSGLTWIKIDLIHWWPVETSRKKRPAVQKQLLVHLIQTIRTCRETYLSRHGRRIICHRRFHRTVIVVSTYKCHPWSFSQNCHPSSFLQNCYYYNRGFAVVTEDLLLLVEDLLHYQRIYPTEDTSSHQNCYRRYHRTAIVVSRGLTVVDEDLSCQRRFIVAMRGLCHYRANRVTDIIGLVLSSSPKFQCSHPWTLTPMRKRC